MCGICGFTWEDKKLIGKMTKKLVHRGLDDYGYYTDSNISLGHRRLSIIDLSRKGRQPMCYEEGGAWIVYNGEMYNYKELRAELEEVGCKFKSDTDTEVLLKFLCLYGFRNLERLNGMFAFALWIPKTKALYLARDRHGIKPLYYHYDEKRKNLVFASEIKAVLEHNIPRVVDSSVLGEYLSFRCVSSENTMFKDIKRLLPGHYIIYYKDKGKIIVKKYWNAEEKIENAPEQYYVRRLKILLDKSVKGQLMSDVPLGAYTSGGIDSGTIVGLMSKHSEEPVKTFSIGFGYKDEHDELANARFIAEHFKTDHREIIVDWDTKTLEKVVYYCDEPIADPTCIPVYLLAEQTKPKVTVVLTGDGGDEQFGGYEQYKFMQVHNDLIKNLPVWLRKSVVSIVPRNMLNRMFPYMNQLGEQGYSRFKSFMLTNSSVEAYLSMVSVFKQQNKNNLEYGKYFVNGLPLLNNIMRLDKDLMLAENMLMKNDKMNMAFGVESRVPLLDNRITELCLKMPPNMKIRGLTDKYVLRRAMKDLLPKQTCTRKKSRFFVPIDKWFEGELMDYAKQLLENQKHFSKKYVERIFWDYKNSRLYYARQLWALVCFELWYREFIVKEKL